MKTKLLVVAMVTILSVLAAVAIAGIPSSRAAVPDTRPVPPPATTEMTITSSVPAETTSTTETPVEDTEPPTTEPDPPVTDPAVTDPAVTDPPGTDPMTTSTAPVEELPIDRELLAVVVANGAAVSGVARETADQLIEFGYVDVRSTDGTEIFAASAIFGAPGLDAEAERLAIDLSIDPSLVFPISSAPALTSDFDDVDLLVYLGVDVDDR